MVPLKPLRHPSTTDAAQLSYMLEWLIGCWYTASKPKVWSSGPFTCILPVSLWTSHISAGLLAFSSSSAALSKARRGRIRTATYMFLSAGRRASSVYEAIWRGVGEEREGQGAPQDSSKVSIVYAVPYLVTGSVVHSRAPRLRPLHLPFRLR